MPQDTPTTDVNRQTLHDNHVSRRPAAEYTADPLGSFMFDVRTYFDEALDEADVHAQLIIMRLLRRVEERKKELA